MTDHTAGGGHGTSSQHHHPARTPRAEFYTYFTLIFLFAIPLSALSDHPEASAPYVRWAFCKRDEVLDEGLRRLRGWLG